MQYSSMHRGLLNLRKNFPSPILFNQIQHNLAKLQKSRHRHNTPSLPHNNSPENRHKTYLNGSPNLPPDGVPDKIQDGAPNELPGTKWPQNVPGKGPGKRLVKVPGRCPGDSCRDEICQNGRKFHLVDYLNSTREEIVF